MNAGACSSPTELWKKTQWSGISSQRFLMSPGQQKGTEMEEKDTYTPCISLQTSEKAMSDLQNSINNYPNVDTGSSFVFPPTYNTYPNNLYNLNQNEQNNFSFMQNGFNPNAFVNYQDNDINTLVGIEPVTDETVTPEQLNLLRLAAQEIGGAQFAIPNKYDEKYYNFFEPSQRNSLPETNMFPQNFNRPNSMNLDMNYNANYDFNNTQRYPNKFENGFVKENETTLLSYLNNLNLSNDHRDESLIQNNDFKMPLDMNSHYQNDEFKFQEKQFYNRNFQQPNNFHGDINFFIHDVMPQMPDRNNMGQNFDYPNQSVPQNSVNFKPNGYNHPNEFMQRRDMTPILSREGFPNGSDQRPNYDNTMNRDGQQALLRQQEIAKQMNLLMRTRPPPNPLNIDVSFMHENTPYLEIEGAMLAWRNAVASVQAARRRELTPAQHRYPHTDPILQLADAVKQLCVCARRARAAMWCDLTLTEKLNETKPEEKMNKQTDKDKNRRAHNYRHKNNTHNRNDLYKNRFVRHPYYIATGSIH
ncbi:unnamed protein product [Leptidea sinapis]|uniref:Uncharacterized protein n=1 Tax=Leptidea sinapis TaxID=189913 RepID=A0A5E4QQL4_9NEOP|nr:unnamed protein product [Leptidea sinapis]